MPEIEFLRAWKGLYTNVNPHDTPPGTTVSQDNIATTTPGILSTRRGIVPLNYAGFTSAGSNDIMSMFKFDTQIAAWVIYELTNGTLKAIRNGAQQNIRTGMNPFQPVCGSRERQGHELIINGIDRGSNWNGLTPLADELGIDGPALACTFSGSTSGGGATAGVYEAAYRYVDRDGLPSNLSPLASITAADGATFSYSGLRGSAQIRVNTIEIYRSTSGEGDVLYLVAVLPVSGVIISIAGTIGDQVATVPAGHGLYMGAVIVISNTQLNAYNGTKTVTAVTTTTFTFSQTPVGNSVGGTWRYDTTSGPAAFTTDTFTDDALSARANLPIFYDNGQYLANRFVPPPTNKPFMAIYRDRAWFYGNVVYTTGTIEVQTATPTILRGTGTAWTPQMVGRYYLPAAGTSTYLISAYTSATQLTLATTAPVVAAGTAYSIINGPDEQRRLYFSEQDEPESVPQDQNALNIQENVQDHDFETGVAAHDTFLYLLHDRHIYALWFTQQPDIDASVQLIAERGCINNRCWVVAAGTMYLLDQLGAYAIQGKSVTPISDQIQDYWRDSRLDFTTSSKWWAEYEPNEKAVKFYVKLTGDSGTRPMRALTYFPFSNSWSTESYPWELGGGCRTTINGKLRLVVGSQLDTVYKTSEGLSDGVTAAILGTATAGASTTLTDSGAAFTSAVVNAPVAIVSGPGKGSTGIITSQTSTQLSLSGGWSGSPPAAGSVYLIGAIAWIFKTGAMKFQTNNKTQARVVNVAYKPTTNAASFDVRRYYNHDTSPDLFHLAQERPDGYSNLTDDADATIQMLLSFFSPRTSQNAPGWNWVEFDDGISQKNVSDRWLALEFRGFQGLDRIHIYNAQVVGVTSNEE